MVSELSHANPVFIIAERGRDQARQSLCNRACRSTTPTILAIPLCGNKARHPADPSPYRGFVFQTRAKARDYIRGILLFKASFDLLEQKPQRPLPLRDEEHPEGHAEMKLGRVRRGCDQNTEGAVE